MKTHHAFLSGLVGGLILDKQALVTLVIGFVLGAGAVLLWSSGVRLVQWGRRLLGRLPAAPYDQRRPW